MINKKKKVAIKKELEEKKAKKKKNYKLPDDLHQIEKVLIDSYGCIQVASKKLGVTRQWLNMLVKDSDVLTSAKEEGRELLKDLAENKQAQIIKNIPVKNPTKPQVQILEGFLRTIVKDRGHIPKIEQDNTHKIEPMIFNYNAPISKEEK